MIRVFTIILLLIVMGGCAYPNQQVQPVDDRPGLIVVGAPQNAVLYVDGLEMGPAQKYNGKPNVLLLNPGTHSVQIRQGDTVLRSMDVFMGEGTRREIKLSGSN